MKILITDDHPIVRRGLKQILDEAFDSVTVDEAGDGSTALSKVYEVAYDIVLLDISMPGMNGLEVLKELKKNNPELPVLILSIYPEQQYAIRCLKAGASGYITKESAPDELALAIQRVLSGKKYINPPLADILAQNLNAAATDLPHEILSDREDQIMRLIASGRKTREIANDLSLSIKTINSHRARILYKMGLHSNTDLIRYAIQNQLIS